MSMLLLNHKMAATEAWENGLVMEVLKPGNFMEQVNSRVKAMTTMPNKVNFINSSQRVWSGTNVYQGMRYHQGMDVLWGLNILRDNVPPIGERFAERDVLDLLLPGH